MKKALTFLFLLTACLAKAQDITGIWHGHFRSGNMSTRSSSPVDDRYKFEVQIAQHDKNIEAVTYSYLSSFFYGKASATGAINLKNGKIVLQEVKLLEVRNQSGEVCIMTCFLQYSKIADEEFLEGKFISMNVKDSSNCGRGSVFLHRSAVSDFYKEPFLDRREKEIAEEKSKVKKDSPLAHSAPPVRTPATTPPPPALAKTPQPKGSPTPKPTTAAPNPSSLHKTKKPAPDNPIARAPVARTIQSPVSAEKAADSLTAIGRHFPTITPKVLQTRSNVLVRTIVVHSNEIELNIYDDGAIDHDTISVYLDKRQVISHRMLTDRPLVLTIHMDENEDYHELVMVAENEGEIPPNTSLMIVKAGDKEYEVRITSNEQKNAMVVFRFEKK